MAQKGKETRKRKTAAAFESCIIVLRTIPAEQPERSATPAADNETDPDEQPANQKAAQKKKKTAIAESKNKNKTIYSTQTLIFSKI